MQDFIDFGLYLSHRFIVREKVKIRKSAMKLRPKPVRKCYRCLLNLDDHCWAFASPRLQWNRKKCPGFENEELYRQFIKWQEAPHIKTRKQLRQEIFRSAKQARRLHYSRKQSTKRCQKK